jgi:pimeloyl-ACP methyl ester carboxylesterase
MPTRRELNVVSGDATLAGTLHLPDGAGPHPALVMLQGSGAADRDGDGYFTPIRDHLVAHGLAVYSYDKPGCGASTGDWRLRTMHSRAREALDAVALLRAQPELDARAVGLWGQSQGGWVAPLAATRAPELPFIVAQSATHMPPNAQDLYNVEHSMRHDGHTEPEIARGLAYIRAIHTAAEEQWPWARVATEVVGPARDAPWWPYYAIANATDWEFVLRWEREGFDPTATLEQMTCPLLALFGELDVLIPAAESAAGVARALAVAGNADATIHVFPGVNHRLKDAATGAFPPDYLPLLTDWLQERVRRARVSFRPAGGI